MYPPENNFKNKNFTFSSSDQQEDSSYHFLQEQIQEAYHKALEKELGQLILLPEHLELVLEAEPAQGAVTELRLLQEVPA